MIAPLKIQLLHGCAATCIWLSVWAFLYALKIVGARPNSLTQRLLQSYRKNPLDFIILSLFFLSAIAWGATKAPLPPLAKTNTYYRARLTPRTPDSSALIPIPGTLEEVTEIIWIRPPAPIDVPPWEPEAPEEEP